MKANKEISQENLTLVFDNDSTLMTGEIVDTLAEILQCEKLIYGLTNRQMDGNSQQSFAENLQARITILVEKNLEKKHFQQCAEKMTWSENAQKLLKTIIKKQGTLKHNFYIFSGGFTEIIYLKINEFDISESEKIILKNQTWANYFQTKNNKIIGISQENSQMLLDDAKGNGVKKLIKNFPGKYFLGCGDGSNDVGMVPKAKGINMAFTEHVRRENTIKKADGEFQNFTEIINWYQKKQF